VLDVWVERVGTIVLGGAPTSQPPT
jgi:hypothetical protein